MADAKPSLTPHRDAIEKAIAKASAEPLIENHWLNRVAAGCIFDVQRRLADLRDQGVTQQEIFDQLPRIIHSIALNALGACGIRNREELLPALLFSATTMGAPDVQRETLARVAVGPEGGRA